MGWDTSLGVEVLFLQFSTLRRLIWGSVSLAHTVSELIFSSDLTLGIGRMIVLWTKTWQMWEDWNRKESTNSV